MISEHHHQPKVHTRLGATRGQQVIIPEQFALPVFSNPWAGWICGIRVSASGIDYVSSLMMLVDGGVLAKVIELCFDAEWAQSFESTQDSFI